MSMFGGQPGRWIGQVKDYLLGLVLDGQLARTTKKQPSAWLASMWPRTWS